MYKLIGRIARITIRGLMSPARREPGEPRDVSLRILFAQSIVMPQNYQWGLVAAELNDLRPPTAVTRAAAIPVGERRVIA
ncbi:MAG TPA: hypothetical protein PLR25_10170 [Planctomycetaceae bacterium]|nr:hypothetical protein [Planctomycetaceae bacterium]